MHDDVRCSHDERKRGQHQLLLWQEKGGADVVDMLIENCTTGIRPESGQWIP